MVNSSNPLVNEQILFVSDPGNSHVQESNMKHVSTPFEIPTNLSNGQVVLKNLYLSLDPYMRGRMNTKAKSYSAPFKLNEVLQGGGVSEVVASNREGFKVGDLVAGLIGWEQYTLVDNGNSHLFQKVDSSVDPKLYLGALGMVGRTAYHGLINICQVKEGETLFVSGAAGAVGHLVGQIAKALGVKTVGSAGSDEKVALLKEKYGYDEAFNYKTVESVTEALAKAAPNGIDAYFDNVGTTHLDAALACMNPKGRIAACGMISQYNGQSYEFKHLTSIVGKEIHMEGFIIFNVKPSQLPSFYSDMAQWVKDGKVHSMVHVVEGLKNAPASFVGLFSGVNTGKLLIKL